jgi:hypothetical protein
MKANAVTLSFTPLRRALFCVGLALGLAGCESMRTVIVHVDFDVALQVRDANGQISRATNEEIVKKRHPQAASPYPNNHYEGKQLEWIIGANPGGIGYFLRSKLAEPICFRFDQATLASNFQPNPSLMRVTWARYGPIDVEGSRGASIKVERGSASQPVSTPSICAATDRGSTFGFVVDFSQLYPNGQIFNINQSGKSLDYTEHGKGNWLKLNVPIEYAGKREEIEVTFTAINSIARYSYH